MVSPPHSLTCTSNLSVPFSGTFVLHSQPATAFSECQKIIYFVIPIEVRTFSLVRTRRKKDPSTHGLPRNDQMSSVPAVRPLHLTATASPRAPPRAAESAQGPRASPAQARTPVPLQLAIRAQPQVPSRAIGRRPRSTPPPFPRELLTYSPAYRLPRVPRCVPEPYPSRAHWSQILMGVANPAAVPRANVSSTTYPMSRL